MSDDCVLVRQRPGTASGVCFITIQGETGIANLVVWQAAQQVVQGKIFSDGRNFR